MSSENYRKALKSLRLKFNLTQKQVADIAGIDQTKYSGFETGKLKLDLDSAQKLSKKIWGVDYTSFVSFSKTEIQTSKLPPVTQKAIKASENTTLNDSTNLLATELDRLISEGYFNTPTTSKLVHSKMDKKLANRKTSEITSLLGRPPRNKYIASIGSYGTQKIYIHKDHATRYKKFSKEDLVKLIMGEEDKVFGVDNGDVKKHLS